MSAEEILLPTPEGGHAVLEGDAVRALIGYVEQRDAHDPGPVPERAEPDAREQLGILREGDHVMPDIDAVLSGLRLQMPHLPPVTRAHLRWLDAHLSAGGRLPHAWARAEGAPR